MATPSPIRIYERYSWVILFAVWALHLFLSLRDFFPASQDFCLACVPGAKPPIQITIGMTWAQLAASAPGYAHFLAATLVDDGISGVGFAVLGMVISMTGYRRGERWAWYFSWSLPIGMLAAQFNQYELTGSLIVILLTLAFFSLSLLGLFLPYRTFFPKKRYPPDEGGADSPRMQSMKSPNLRKTDEVSRGEVFLRS